jgi:hypothetical protein
MFEIDWPICFSNILLPYKLDIFWLECEKGEKPQIPFKNPLIQKIIKYNISSIYNLLKGYKVDCELVKISMNLLKFTLNM